MIGRPPERPSINDQAAVQRLCERLSSGLSMRQVCAEDDVPSSTAVYERMARDEDFRSKIARAREAQADANVDQIVDMADAATPEDWQVVKLRIYARQWRASKLAPKVYGDRTEVDLTVKKSASEMSDTELDAAIAARLATQKT